MNIYSFFRSRDVAAHCKKIKKTWTSFEMAVIIASLYLWGDISVTDLIAVQNKILLKYIQKNEIDVPRISGFREDSLRDEDLEFDLS